jgi:hypothetical protein
MEISFVNASFAALRLRRVSDVSQTLRIRSFASTDVPIRDICDFVNHLVRERILLVLEDHGNVCLTINPD